MLVLWLAFPASVTLRWKTADWSSSKLTSTEASPLQTLSKYITCFSQRKAQQDGRNNLVVCTFNGCQPLCLGTSLDSVSLWRPRLCPRPVHVTFVEDEVARELVFLPVLRSFLCQYHSGNAEYSFVDLLSILSKRQRH